MITVQIKADSRYPVNRKRVRGVVKKFLSEEMRVNTPMEVGVMIVGDRKMKELNKKYLKRDETTDVLSFSQTEQKGGREFVEPRTEGLYLGDLVVSWPVAKRQALERQTTIDEEIDFLVQHGLLHLMGIHHD